MKFPVQVKLNNVGMPAAVCENVMQAATILERFHPAISGCRVAVKLPYTHDQRDMPFHVRIMVQIPGHPDIVVNRLARGQPQREHLQVSLRKAFALASRRLLQSEHRKCAER